MRDRRQRQSTRRVGTDRPLTAFDEVVFAVGDIHGRLDLLDTLLRKIQQRIEQQQRRASFPLRGRLVFLGDYVDRGPDSRGVIDRLISLELPDVDIVCLKGNHEAVLLDVLERPDRMGAWCRHGGAATLRAYGIDVDENAAPEALEDARERLVAAMPASHRAFLRGLPSFYSHGRLFFVHAGVDPDRPIAAQDDAQYLWIREPFLHSRKPLEAVVVHGHTPQDAPSWDGRRIGLDTGAYFTNRLNSAMVQDNTVEFISA